MGGINALARLFLSPPYILVFGVIVFSALLTAKFVAPLAFARMGLTNLIRGSLLLLLSVLIIFIFLGGLSTSTAEAFALATILVLIVTTIFCVPIALLLISFGKYKIVWFVLVGTVTFLLATLSLEILTGPAAIDGFFRWGKSIPILVVSLGSALFVFAIGSRVPFSLAN